jgi:predicted negative regulator of RcsB-dependent stress response
MDEEITIIDTNTRNEKIKKFFINNKSKLTVGISIIFILIIGYFSLNEIKKKNKISLANKFNLTKLNFKTEDKKKTVEELINIIKQHDTTYSPLALYFLIDNDLIKNKEKINILFDELIDKTNLDDEIKNLNIYKKGLFNSNFVSENELLKILNPLINSESAWKSHALYLVAEYFYTKGESQKAKEFFEQILTLKKANKDIRLASQKRVNRDIGE